MREVALPRIATPDDRRVILALAENAGSWRCGLGWFAAADLSAAIQRDDEASMALMDSA